MHSLKMKFFGCLIEKGSFIYKMEHFPIITMMSGFIIMKHFKEDELDTEKVFECPSHQPDLYLFIYFCEDNLKTALMPLDPIHLYNYSLMG